MARSKQTKKRVQQQPASESEDEGQEYEVKSFLDHRRTKKKGLEYFVSWVGYSASHNSWEPAENVSTADLLLAKYWKNKSPAEELERYEPGTSAYRKFIAAHPEVNPANKYKKNATTAKAASASPPKKRTSSKRKADDNDDEEEEEEEEEEDVKPKAKTATRRKSTGSTGATPKKRQSRSSTGATPQKRAAKKAKKEEPELAEEEEEEEEADEEEEEEAEEEEEEAPMAPAPIAGDGVEEEDDDEESGELVDWETLPFAQNDNWEDEIDQVTTVRMDGEIPRGLTGQARLDAERHVRETMMKYLVRWRRHVNENGTGSEEGDELKQQSSEVPNLVLKERAPKAIIRFFEARIKFRGADGAYAQPQEQEQEREEEELEEQAAVAAGAGVEANGATDEVEAAGEEAAAVAEEEEDEEEEEEEEEAAMAVDGGDDAEEAYEEFGVEEAHC
ncbi:hypothetical protein JCM8115_003042 [Rhodotorula mucilaginosa]